LKKKTSGTGMTKQLKKASVDRPSCFCVKNSINIKIDPRGGNSILHVFPRGGTMK